MDYIGCVHNWLLPQQWGYHGDDLSTNNGDVVEYYGIYIYIIDVVGYYGDIMGYMYITTQLDMDSFCVLKGGGFAQCFAF